MTVFTPGQLKGLAVEAGFAEAEANIAAAIAAAESGGDSDAVGDKGIQTAKWGPSVGLWQIRSLKNPDAETNTVDRMRVASKLKDPKYNASVAYELYKQKGDWFDWSVFGKDKYNGYLEKYFSGDKAGETVMVTSGDATGTTVGRVADNTLGLGNLNDLAGRLQDGALWKRAGWYVAGYFLLVAGLIVILLSNKDVKSVGGTAVNAAIGLVPGGGTVKAVAGGASMATKAVAKTASGAAKATGSGAAGAVKTVGSGAAGAVKTAGKTVTGK